METPAPASGLLDRLTAWLDPERKRLLLAGCLGYGLCLWQALCVFPPWPRLAQPPRPDILDMAGPGLSPPLLRKLTLDMLMDEPLPAPGDVSAHIDPCFVRQPVDLDTPSPEDPDAWSMLAQMSLWGKSEAIRRPTPTYTLACLIPPRAPGARPSHAAPPGRLAARFESGEDGVAAVGHTPSAGTSYGTFQIAAGTPTYANFLRYLKEHAPELQDRLSGRGPADTGGISGSVPKEWRRIAEEFPARFARLQYDFILATHYRPAVAEIFDATGLDVAALSPASREVLWSTAVQHGPGGAADIFTAAVKAIRNRVVEEPKVEDFERALIEEVYHQRLLCWGNAPYRGRGAMLTRYGREKAQALGLLDRHYSGG